MTREERLASYQLCTNRKMDFQKGLICNLTGEHAAFEGECPDFNRDESVKEKPTLPDAEGENVDLAAHLDPEVFDRLKEEQNLVAGIIAASVAGLIGAILWGAITVITEYQIGFMAIAIGAAVGIAMRMFGKGLEPIYGFIGAGISLLSVVLGNFFTIVGFVANAEGLGYVETLTLLDYGVVPELMTETFSVMDLLFYAIALYEGYRFSFRVVSEEDLQ